jgi:Mrp family chromosome partitioning ATPase
MKARRPRHLRLDAATDREPLPAALSVPEAMLTACRAASLRIGTPNLRNLGVTSTLRGEGRTSIAMAMAAVHRDDFGRSVVLLDLDLEGPTLARRLRAAPVPGLCELVREECTLADAIQSIGNGISFISAGVASGSIARTVTETGKLELVARLEQEFGMVIADLPPLLGSASGRSAAALFTDLLLVVRAGVTPVARAKEATANLPVEPSVLLNGTQSQLPRWVRRLVGD